MNIKRIFFKEKGRKSAKIYHHISQMLFEESPKGHLFGNLADSSKSILKFYTLFPALVKDVFLYQIGSTYMVQYYHLKIGRENPVATRSESIKRARDIKTQRAKDKIIGAMNILKLYGKKPTIRAIAEEAGVSKRRVQKYLNA